MQAGREISTGDLLHIAMGFVIFEQLDRIVIELTLKDCRVISGRGRIGIGSVNNATMCVIAVPSPILYIPSKELCPCLC